MLKTTAAALALGTLTLMSGAALMMTWSPAQAANEYPWCVQYSESTVGATNCGFVTLAQCTATASGMNARCYENPAYPELARPKRHSAQRN